MPFRHKIVGYLEDLVLRFMINLFSRFYSICSSSKEEAVNMEGFIIKWDIDKGSTPIICKRLIYKHSNFKIIPYHKSKLMKKQSHSYEVNPMIIKEIMKSYMSKNEFIHIGLIQVAVKPLVWRGIDIAKLLCLRDGWLTNFQDFLLDTVEVVCMRDQFTSIAIWIY